jgi:D-alanyl-lipoteichoic acid acyltransferase DltB (MBOAT superfamily)
MEYQHWMPRLVAVKFVKSLRPWIVYSALRIVVFGIALAILLLLHVNWIVAAVVATVVGVCISYIFFRGLRNDVALDIVARRSLKIKDSDNDLENEVLDRLEESTLEENKLDENRLDGT